MLGRITMARFQARRRSSGAFGVCQIVRYTRLGPDNVSILGVLETRTMFVFYIVSILGIDLNMNMFVTKQFYVMTDSQI